MDTATLALPSLLLTHASDERDDLSLAPITPADILSGTPVARSLALADLGDGLSVWLWDCTAGSFRWHYGPCDEVVHVVSGGVTITDAEGAVVRLRAGDVTTFAAGSSVTWEVEDHIKKVAVVRTLPRDPLSRVVAALRRLAKRLLGRG